MLNRFFGNKYHDYFHIFGICAFSIGLPTSKVILSLSMMLLVLNLVLESNYKTYWNNIRNNKLFLILAAFWVFHLIALFWTEDMVYAVHDIRIKLTLLVIPLVFAVKPVTNAKHLLLILLLFVGTVLVTSLYNFASFHQWFGNHFYKDIRELSRFGSHIRYGILVAMAAGICLFYLWKLETRKKWFLLAIFGWLCYYTYFSQIISGLIAFLVVLLTFGIYISFSKSRKLGFTILSFLLGILVISVFLINSKESEKISMDIHKLETHTPYGNLYIHNLDSNTFIDGKPIFSYVCELELEQEWEKKSNYAYFGEDDQGQPLRFTLMRYMTSKGLRKDGKDFKKLSKKDIRYIESGVANIDETNQGFRARLTGIKFQLYNTVDPNGHSLLQRLEFWKTGLQIIKKHWAFGVGTGDVQKAFDQQYEIQDSPLHTENRLRAHNTYLTNWISFGILGFLLFMWMLFAFLTHHWKNKAFLPIMFILIAMSTFFIEDTLETQMGVSFFAFFYGLFFTSQNELKKIP